MRQLHRVANAQFATDGAAVILHFEFTDGTKEPIEVPAADIKELLLPLFAACAGLGERQATRPPLTETKPADALLLPGEELHAISAGGPVWLMFRMGSVDTAIALPDRKSARLLGDELTKAATRQEARRTGKKRR